MTKRTMAALRQLPDDEKAEPAQTLWESVGSDSTPVVPEWERKEIERRLEAYRKNPSPGRPAVEVFRRLLDE